MSKKLLIIGTVLLIVILGAAGGYFIFSKKTQLTANPNRESNSGLSQLLGKTNDSLISYQDSSGFSFDYPQTIALKDVTPESGNYYSLLELSKSDQTLKISIADGNTNPYKNDNNAKLVGSTTLGGISSNQYVVNDRLVSVAIDQGVLYVIDGPKDGGYWENAQNSILTSFKFGTQADTFASDANTSYEEEVVQ